MKNLKKLKVSHNVINEQFNKEKKDKKEQNNSDKEIDSSRTSVQSLNDSKIMELANNYIIEEDLNRNEIKEILNSKKEIIKNFIMNKTDNFYFMLLCNERKDYTIFDFDGWKSSEKSLNCAKCLVDECLANRGEIRGIDLTKDKTAIEIWMIIDDEAYVYYFFPYDDGVIYDF